MIPDPGRQSTRVDRFPPPRVVRLVLVSPGGEVLGALQPFVADTPWWMDVGPVVRGVRDRFGLDVIVLRLLEAEQASAHGGAVTYLAEVDPAALARTAPLPDLDPWTGTLPDHPLRRPYARPGGPTADLAWADQALAAAGSGGIRSAEQVRTWNLSSLWRLSTADGIAWLKVVPPWFEHEGDILAHLAGEAVPRLLGHEGPRILMAEIPGEDRYDAPLPELLAMVEVLVDLQRRWLGRTDEALALGLPDWRGPALTAAIADVVERADPAPPSDDRAILMAFLTALPGRLAALAGCGLGDSIVHGDFHPGNVRGDGTAQFLLDWGDSGIGHPLLDEAAFLDRIEAGEVTPVRDHWHAAWRRAVPGSDPDRAARLLEPIAAARQAVIYQHFLDGIEPSERPYHQADVLDWLHRSAVILGRGTGA